MPHAQGLRFGPFGTRWRRQGPEGIPPPGRSEPSREGGGCWFRPFGWPLLSDLVFPSTTGTPMLPENLHRRVLKPAAQEAGVPWAGFHAFRHACASMLIADGRNIVQVSRWLGHHSPSFTLDVYAHLMDDGVGDALDVKARPADTATAVPPTPLGGGRLH